MSTEKLCTNCNGKGGYYENGIAHTTNWKDCPRCAVERWRHPRDAGNDNLLVTHRADEPKKADPVKDAEDNKTVIPNSIKAMRKMWQQTKYSQSRLLTESDGLRIAANQAFAKAEAFEESADLIEKSLKELGYATTPQAGE